MAAAIEEGDPGSADQNAALIAEHLEAAGDLRAAVGWHMRAGNWSLSRDRAAARVSWQRARQLADGLPAVDPHRMAMQIAPLTLLCGTGWLAGGSVNDSAFQELRELCEASGDKASLAMGMAGLVMALAGHNRLREASQLASELTALTEAIGNPTLTVALLLSANNAKSEIGEMTEALRLAQRVIDLADGDPTMGNNVMGSPLALAIAMRGFNRLCLGIEGWRSDADEAITLAASVDPTTHVSAVMYKYVLAVPIGALPADPDALGETADALRIAEQASDVFTLALAQLTRGLVMVHSPHRREGFDLLAQARDAALKEGFSMNALSIVDPALAREKARNGDLDGAIELVRTAIDYMFETCAKLSHGIATTVLVESLLDPAAMATCKKRRMPSTGWQPYPLTPVTFCTNFRCFGYRGWWRVRGAMKSLTASSWNATAPKRRRLASNRSSPRRASAKALRVRSSRSSSATGCCAHRQLRRAESSR